MHVKKSKIIRTVSWLDTGIFMVTSTLLVLLTVYGVIMRYCIKSPLTWLEEVQMILSVQVSFFGGSIAFRERGHICVDLLVDAFPKKLHRVVDVFVWVLVLLSLLFIGYLEGQRTISQFLNGRCTNILRIPMYLDYAGVTFATLLMTINHVAVGCEDFFMKGEKDNAE